MRIYWKVIIKEIQPKWCATVLNMTYICVVQRMRVKHLLVHAVAYTISITHTHISCVTEAFHSVCPHVELPADHTDATTVDQELLDHCLSHVLTLHQH